MNTIRLANMKSIRDSGVIELKPITILVGKNSSGKSSFLRLFSLLRQSVEVRTTSPFLWYGQYVDFGSFKEAVRHDSSPQQIIFEFSFTLTDDLLSEIYPLKFSNLRHLMKRLASLKNSHIRIELTLACPQERAYISNILLYVESDSIILSFDNVGNVTKFRINDLDIAESKEEFIINNIGKTIPGVTTRKYQEDKEKQRDYYYYVYGGINKAIQTALISATFDLFRGNTKEANRIDAIQRISIEPLPKFIETLSNINAGSVFQENVRRNSKSKLMNKIRNLAIGTVVPGLLLSADEELSRVARNVRSIAPVRATVERYYRKQDLGINEIDYKGQNLAMFLSGLNFYTMESFQEWTINNLKFGVSVKNSEGHVEVFLEEVKGSNKYNLADSGFGYSQLLPIVAQLWSMLNPPYKSPLQRSATNIFTIEQPELHLHPSFQAKVADLMIATIEKAKEENIELRLIVETHSEAIINRIGNQIAKGKLSSKDVNIVMFEKQGPNESTEISVAEYDKDGYLINWPYGFFEAEED
jgi:AAA15 family ATPase/GTPase